MNAQDFTTAIGIDRETLEIWLANGWLRPRLGEPATAFSDVDLARARLISDLTGSMGVNQEGLDIILDLLDQVHGLRHAMMSLSQVIEVQPDEVRYRFRAESMRLAGVVNQL